MKLHSEFSRNVVTLMTGRVVAQAIPIAISPILTRIYTPEDFGVFALFLAMTAIFGSIVNAKYELALMLVKKDEDAINIMALGVIIASLISFVLFWLVFLYNDSLTHLLGNDAISRWLYLVPFSVLLTGFWNLLTYFNSRRKNYQDLRNATIVKSIITAIIQLCIGFVKQGALGLVSGQMAAQIFANTKLLKNILQERKLLSKVSKVRVIALAKRYKNFPKYSMWGGLLNTSSLQLTSILIPSLYGVATLGFYSLAQKVLGLPSSLLGGAIAQVFFEEATKEKQETKTAIKSFTRTIKKLIIVGLPVFILLFFFIEDIFAFVFGEEWRVAGVYAQIITPLFFIRFVVATVSIVDTVEQRQEISLLFNATLMLVSLMILYISRDQTFRAFLENYTFGLGITYCIYGYILYKMAKNEFHFWKK